MHKLNSLACHKFTTATFTNKQMVSNFKNLSTLQLSFRQINFYISCFNALSPLVAHTFALNFVFIYANLQKPQAR
ncbi:hypothetical protein [Campylobacter concisus]|uniref:hypothetical protein n=1 Tax=Campylobacter concisus TaxID=199 RepID=UPI0011E6439C|nr:hypothetical protein [Campylobacter concisus]